MPKSMQSSRLSAETQPGLARPSNASGTKARIDVANTGRTRERALTTVTLTTWLCWTKKQCGSDASASRAQ
jgi:hypothetical protein